jgi:hypothetical protein
MHHRNLHITPQYPIKNLISKVDFEFLDDVFQKHQFDYYIRREGFVVSHQAVIEVNYKHKTGAARKMYNVFKPLMEKNGIKYITVDDWDCRNLFRQTDDKAHKLSWDDFRDVIDALEKAGMEPEIN